MRVRRLAAAGDGRELLGDRAVQSPSLARRRYTRARPAVVGERRRARDHAAEQGEAFSCCRASLPRAASSRRNGFTPSRHALRSPRRRARPARAPPALLALGRGRNASEERAARGGRRRGRAWSRAAGFPTTFAASRGRSRPCAFRARDAVAWLSCSSSTQTSRRTGELAHRATRRNADEHARTRCATSRRAALDGMAREVVADLVASSAASCASLSTRSIRPLHTCIMRWAPSTR